MNVVINNKQIQKVILNGRTCFAKMKEPNVADIFNHGDIQGLNPNYVILQGTNSGYLFRYNDTTTKDYLISPGGTGWSNNTSILFYYPYLKNTEYTKLFIELEVTQGKNGEYQHLNIGVTDNGVINNSSLQNLSLYNNSGDAHITNYTYYYQDTLIEWSNKYNAINNNPYYLMPRHTFCFNIPTTTEFLLCPFVYVGFETTIIHSVWLEP